MFFSKRTIPISLQIEKEIPGAEGLLGLEAAILLEKDKRTAPTSLQLEKEIPGAEGLLGFEAAFLSEKDKRTARPSWPGPITAQHSQLGMRSNNSFPPSTEKDKRILMN